MSIVSSFPATSRGKNLFYAYGCNLHRCNIPVYLIIFAGRDIGDNWYRRVSSKTHPNNVPPIYITRKNPQYYVFGGDDRPDEFTAKAYPEYCSRVSFISLKESGISSVICIPDQDITDHVHGEFFFIRSKHGDYWFCPTDEAGDIKVGAEVYASRTERTRFQISIDSDETWPTAYTIMVGSDPVTIKTDSGLYVNFIYSWNTTRALDVQYRKPDRGLFLFRTLNLGEGIRIGRERKLNFSGLGEEWELVHV